MTSTPCVASGWAVEATRTYGPRPRAQGRFLVTHDLNFSDTRKFEPGTHADVLIVRLPESEQWLVGDHLVGWLSHPDAQTLEELHGARDAAQGCASSAGQPANASAHQTQKRGASLL